MLKTGNHWLCLSSFPRVETRFNTHYQNAYANAFRNAFLELLRHREYVESRGRPFLCLRKWTTLYRERWEFATCLVRVWLASAFIIRNSDTYKQLFYIMYRVSILWGEKAGGRKWDDQMGEWSGARGCPENGMWVDGGKAWPWIRAWMNVRVECGSHGNGEMEMGSKMVQFIDHDIYKHNIPPLVRK